MLIHCLHVTYFFVQDEDYVVCNLGFCFAVVASSKIAEKIKKKEITLAQAVKEHGILRSTLRYYTEISEKARMKNFQIFNQ